MSIAEQKERELVEKMISSYSLVEVADRILDKSIVIDAWVRATLVGIELLAIEARTLRAVVETFLRYVKVIDLTSTTATV